MPKKGTYGNKHIFVLHADGEHHHKYKCIHYDKDEKYCNYKMTKCSGSANCYYYNEYYFPKLAVKKQETPSTDTIYSAQKNDITQSSKEENKSNKSKTFADFMPGHSPSFGEKLLNKLVAVKGFGKITFGVVISENHDNITIKMDSGLIRKYDRKIAIRQKVIWVVDNIKKV